MNFAFAIEISRDQRHQMLRIDPQGDFSLCLFNFTNEISKLIKVYFFSKPFECSTNKAKTAPYEDSVCVFNR